jgi:hypothetical protein
MAIDMTVQLMPMVWGLVGVLAVAGGGIVASVLPHVQVPHPNWVRQLRLGGLLGTAPASRA